MNKGVLPASFRDPAGYLYQKDAQIYRQVNPFGYQDFFAAKNSGLYTRLIERGWLIEHTELTEYDQDSPPEGIILQPERVPFISYPYEWCFSQLKHAALLTLKIQTAALEVNLSLKDCSAYNIQYLRGRPVLIDTLSFERYQEGEPWAAYRQFCQHFLAPLTLMAYNDIRLSQLLRVYIDGIPLDLASRLLPRKTSLNMGINMHIHLHARSSTYHSDKTIDKDAERRQMRKHQLLGLVQNLESTISKLDWKPEQTDWAQYEAFHNYSDASLGHKQDLVAGYLSQAQPSLVWDLGANTGKFSRLASDREFDTIAFDIDPGAVELNYQRLVDNKEKHLLPLVMDLANPSPDLGWALQERSSLLDRGPADLVMALALIHHLVIGNNVPLDHLASFFAQITNWLIIEFVPKQDPQVQKLLQVRQDIFTDYTPGAFLTAFKLRFNLIAEHPIQDSQRTLYLFRLRG